MFLELFGYIRPDYYPLAFKSKEKITYAQCASLILMSDDHYAREKTFEIRFDLIFEIFKKQNRFSRERVNLENFKSKVGKTFSFFTQKTSQTVKKQNRENLEKYPIKNF